MHASPRLNLAEFDAMTVERGWNTDKERAEGLGISQPMLSRIRSGSVKPGVIFIDRCLKAFGPLAYDRLFPRAEVRS
jgi:transcriptional regulator with XRE-family HTH domain